VRLVAVTVSNHRELDAAVAVVVELATTATAAPTARIREIRFIVK
jgi:hypothetical protein